MNLIKKLFGGGSGESKAKKPNVLIEDVLNTLIEKANLDLSFDLEEIEDQKVETYKANFYGADDEMLTDRDGLLLDSLQLFVKRTLQHNFPENPVNITCDANDFRAKESEYLESMIEKLKAKVLDQGRSVYVKALPPKERRIVHQFLAKDERVKSKSIGDGHFKKIKIYPVNASKS